MALCVGGRGGRVVALVLRLGWRVFRPRETFNRTAADRTTVGVAYDDDVAALGYFGFDSVADDCDIV